MAEHTKGPWEVYGKHPAVVGVKSIFGSPSMDDSQLSPVRAISPGVNQDANACLIAAAPDMLEELERLLLPLNAPENYRLSMVVERVTALIAKAKGEPE